MAIKINKNIKIERLDLSVRAYNCIKRARMDTVQDIVDNMDELPNIRNMGRSTWDEILEKIKPYVEDTDEKSEESDSDELTKWVKEILKTVLGIQPKMTFLYAIRNATRGEMIAILEMVSNGKMSDKFCSTYCRNANNCHKCCYLDESYLLDLLSCKISAEDAAYIKKKGEEYDTKNSYRALQTREE